jgi:hypothetical protein
MKLLIKILVLVVFVSCTSFAQLTDTTYSLTAEAGVGYSRYFTTMDYDKLNKNGFSGTVRIMWNPEHLLSVGLETGYQYLYSIDISNYDTEFGTTDFSASMYTIPIFVMFSMKVTPNIRFNAGTGMYLLFNSGNMFDDALESNQISIGGHFGVAYTYPINKNISVGGELLYSYFSKIQDQTVALQFVFVYKFLEW